MGEPSHSPLVNGKFHDIVSVFPYRLDISFKRARVVPDVIFLFIHSIDNSNKIYEFENDVMLYYMTLIYALSTVLQPSKIILLSSYVLYERSFD